MEPATLIYRAVAGLDLLMIFMKLTLPEKKTKKVLAQELKNIDSIQLRSMIPKLTLAYAPTRDNLGLNFADVSLLGPNRFDADDWNGLALKSSAIIHYQHSKRLQSPAADRYLSCTL